LRLPIPLPWKAVYLFHPEQIMPQYKQNDGSLPAELRESILLELPFGLCVARQDAKRTILFANESFYQMFGYESPAAAQTEGFLGAFDRVDPKFTAVLEERASDLLSCGCAAASFEIRQRKQGGGTFWTMVRIQRAQSQDPVWVCAFMDISAQKHVEEELRFREEEYRIAVRQSDKLVLRYDIAKKAAYLPPESAAIFHQEVFYEIPERLENGGFIGPDSVDAFHELYDRITSGSVSSGNSILQMKFSRNASFEWFRIAYSLIYREDNTPAQAVISLQNISEQHEREVAYKRWEQTYAAMPQSMTTYIEFDLTQNRLELQKGALIERIPPDMDQTVENVAYYFIDHWAHPEDREKLRSCLARDRMFAAYFRGVTPERVEYRHLHKNGRYGWVRLSVQMLPDPYSANVRASLLLRDIDEKKREELNLQNRLRTDPLTGALNRTAFIAQAEIIFGDAKPGSLQVLLMVDVDHFKQVNDRFGHGFGDRVLIRVTQILRSALRADDLVARLGGDEFVILLRNVSHADALTGKLERLRKQLYQRISEESAVSCSFGAAICPRDGSNFDELYRKADIALYEAKNSGRNCARIYHESMDPPITLFGGTGF